MKSILSLEFCRRLLSIWLRNEFVTVVFLDLECALLEDTIRCDIGTAVALSPSERESVRVVRYLCEWAPGASEPL